jgi:8-oxo-dGTP pyrophosphatase MutT (NUDIX family)
VVGRRAYCEERHGSPGDKAIQRFRMVNCLEGHLFSLGAMRGKGDRLPLLSREQIYDGRVLRLERDSVREWNGVTGIREVVRHAGSVAAVAVHEDGRVVLVRQYRHPIGEHLWELPAGLLNPGEDPADGARRELEEEAGLSPARMDLIADFYTTPGFCDERMYVFRATGLTEIPPRPDDDEDIEVKTCTLSEAQEMIARGEIREGKTLIGLLLEAQSPRPTR